MAQLYDQVNTFFFLPIVTSKTNINFSLSLYIFQLRVILSKNLRESVQTYLNRRPLRENLVKEPTPRSNNLVYRNMIEEEEKTTKDDDVTMDNC